MKKAFKPKAPGAAPKAPKPMMPKAPGAKSPGKKPLPFNKGGKVKC